MFILSALVSFWQHSIYQIFIQQTISEQGDLETTVSISNGYKLKLCEHFYQCNCPDHHNQNGMKISGIEKNTQQQPVSE